MKILSLVLCTTFLFSCSGIKKNTIHKSNDEANGTLGQKAPYTLLISLDGFRWDYVQKYKPKFLSQFAKEGARLKSLRPSYPTKTFPNHLSIVTGMYPQNHGIIANHFYAPDIQKTYSLRDRDAVKNPDFYKALPIWGLAEKNKVKTATYFWPGSESLIQETRPSYYLDYNHSTPHSERVETVLSWFKIKESHRPHFMTLYFHDVDSAGHRHGPNSQEVKTAINKVDTSLEKLVSGIRKLDFEVNIIIVSDHGMAELSSKNYIALSSEALKGFKAIGAGPIVHIYKETSKKKLSSVVHTLNKGAKHYRCYEYKKTPKKFKISKNQRIGDITCLAKRGWSIGVGINRVPKGNHGWSQFDSKDMHGIFYAQGPSFKKNFEYKTVENVNIYPLLAHILGLSIPHKIDGKLSNIESVLK